MSNRILIITCRDDLHADKVEISLHSKGATPFRINLDEFPKDYDLNMTLVQGTWQGSINHRITNNSVSIEDIGAIWLRKSAEYCYASDDLSPQEKAFAKQETEHTLFSLLYSLDCFWMSHPKALRAAQWKGEQLKRASQLGFRVPKSIISNQPASVRKFKNEIPGDIIFKAMSSSFLGADKVETKDLSVSGLSTTVISEEQLESIDAISELACCFQEYIPKKYELRVTVIGHKIFAAKIDSQADPRTKTDFRDFSVDIPYQATQLPESIERQCLAFVHDSQLMFGALDIIVTPDDEYVFLENNPAGQFLFVEQLVPTLKMIDAMADCLITGAQC